ncbi:MAG: SCO family protein [Planctomycetes bacterium]|nr:SCO family protein [Planctomycetota bacterium]
MSEPAQRPAGFDITRALVWAVVVAVVTGVVGAALFVRQASPAPDPTAPDADLTDETGPPPAPTSGLFSAAIGHWPDLPAVERSGIELRTGELTGRFLVVDFVFSSCAGTCPRLQKAMAQLQDATKGADDVRFVSVSVDPARDTPELLRGWADAFHADRSRWLYLLLSDANVRKLMKDSVKVPVADDLILHSNLFMLIDPDGNVRGRYSPLEHENWMPVLLADVAKLRTERVQK